MNVTFIYLLFDNFIHSINMKMIKNVIMYKGNVLF